jgi:type II secretory pathway pseudopilin PulG
MGGMTLLEVMMVMVIAAFFVVLSIRVYVPIQRGGDVAQVQANVDQLFQAASYYYQANCRRQVDPVTGPIAGTGLLEPTTTYAPANPFPVTVAALRTAGFLDVPLPLNKIVQSASANNGYMVQFNGVTPSADRLVRLTSTTTMPAGKIIMWRIQVAVQLRDLSTATTYGNLLGADCLSSLSSGVVTPCGVVAPPTAGVIYAVWERLPSLAVPTSTSQYWMLNSVVKEFTNEYQTVPASYSAGLPTLQQQNYLCGS